MGLAWWALDFPFMRRHSEEALKAHPELRRKDQEATRLACQKFSLIPTSVMNFCEGTRFTRAKQQRQQSPFRHLLKPKAGGIALALNVMGDRFRAILDVTIVYPEGAPRFWDFLCGRMKRGLRPPAGAAGAASAGGRRLCSGPGGARGLPALAAATLAGQGRADRATAS
jgi:hypothetical protein